jgi:NAD(P)-dependent dehydrogenase (short-subunit alcohol dehydrogenase family)
MASIFITGSSDGLGLLAAKWLINEGHRVILHARNSERGRDALDKVPGAEKVLIADLSSMEETKKLAGD